MCHCNSYRHYVISLRKVVFTVVYNQNTVVAFACLPISHPYKQGYTGHLSIYFILSA